MGNAPSVDERKYELSDAEGLQLHAGRNLWQAASLVLFAIVGVAVGSSLKFPRPELAALAGGVIGAVVGTFLSGLVLMLVPPQAAKVSLAEVQAIYRSRMRRMYLSFAVAIAIIAVVAALVKFGPRGNAFEWFFFAALPFILYANQLGFQLKNWKCPNCGQRFAEAWTVCKRCGLEVENASK
jgi:hypothetical protein